MRLFISHTIEDVDVLPSLVSLLNRGGHETSNYPTPIPEKNRRAELLSLIEACDACLCVITPAALASPQVQWEMNSAHVSDKRIIPLIFKSVDAVVENSIDFTQGITPEATADLLTLLRHITPPLVSSTPSEAVRNTPEKTTINEEATKDPSKKEREWTSSVIIATVVAILGLIVTIISILPEIQRNSILYTVRLIPPSPTALPPSPTATPQRLPADSFNVIVVGFGLVEGNTVVTSSIADDMSDVVYGTIAEMPQVEYLLGWRDSGVGHILSTDAVEREAQAAQIAEALNADVVIYGLVREDGLFYVFEPEFFVTAAFASLEPELVGGDSLGTPVDFVASADDQELASTNVQRRLRVIQGFLRGLLLYIEGDFGGSREEFEEALEIEPEGVEVLYIFAANAAVREPNFEVALTLYNQALEIRPEYARALVGRGIVFLRMAQEAVGDTPPAYDRDLTLADDLRCADTEAEIPTQPQLQAEFALRCFNEAAVSPDQPETADIDVKTVFGLGQTYTWLSTNNLGDYWEEAETALRQVIALYDSAPQERQARIRAAAGHAHAWLGLGLLATEGADRTSANEALNEYNMAIALLRADVNREYNQHFIDLYSQQITALRGYLATSTPRPTVQRSSTPAVTLTPTLEPTATSTPRLRG